MPGGAETRPAGGSLQTRRRLIVGGALVASAVVVVLAVVFTVGGVGKASDKTVSHNA
jgi:hypothetical protein